MARQQLSSLWLDYGEPGLKEKFLLNLSAATTAGKFLWTTSDEMRSIECLAPLGDGYSLHRQYVLDAVISALPGAKSGDEADVESLDAAQGRLWICGSHSLTRRNSSKSDSDGVDPRIRKRPSRRLLAALPLSKDGDAVSAGEALPFRGTGSLRAVLGGSEHIAPFMELLFG